MFDGLLRHFPDVGLDAHGFVSDVAEAPSAPTSVRGIPGPSLPARLRAMRSAIRTHLQRHPVDVVGSHFALYTAPVLDLLGDRPLVVHFHGPWALESAAEHAPWWNVGAKKILEKMVYRRAQHFIVLSDAFRTLLTTEYGVPEHNISIIPGGVDLNHFARPLSRRDARQHLHLPPDRPTVVSVRRLARRMGLEHLLDAWKKVITHCPDALLLVAGKGPLRDPLQTQIDALGLHDHVRLLGFVPDADLPLLYRAADVSVLPTVTLEGFGLTSIESLASGTPVLVTPVGGLPEVVQSLSASLVLPDASPSSIARGLSSALLHPSSLPSADACRTFVEERYAWPVVAAQTRAVYERVAKTPRELRS